MRFIWEICSSSKCSSVHVEGRSNDRAKNFALKVQISCLDLETVLKTVPELFPNIRNSGTRGPKNFEKLFYIEETCCFSNCSWVREEVNFNNCAKNFALEVQLFLAQISKWIKASELCRRISNWCAGDVKTKIFNSAGKNLSKVEKISALSPKMIWKIMFWCKILFLSGMDFCLCRFGFWQLGRKVWSKSEKLTHEVRRIKKSVRILLSLKIILCTRRMQF